MGSRLRQLRLLRFTVALAVVGCTATLVSSALGSTFPGKNGKLVYSVYNGTAHQLFTAAADGSGQKQITTPAAKQQGDLQPRFSADGKKVVFMRNPQQYGYTATQIWVAEASGGAAHQVAITGLPSNTSERAPTFTPDGKTIVFELDNINAPIGIWKVPVGGGTATQLTSGNDYQPTVSPDGTKIAFMRAATLVIAKADGSNPHTLYTEPATASSIDVPDFSPNGSTIAFMQLNKSTLSWDIYTIPAAGGTATNLTNGTSVSSMDPSFSPDGTKLAFTAVNNTTYASSIDEMPVSGGAATTVVTSPKGGVVSSPDWGNQPPPPPPPHKHHKHKHHKHHRHHKHHK